MKQSALSPLDPTLSPLDPMRRYPVNAACGYLGLSRATFYRRAAAGEVKLIKDGKRTFVPGAEIARLSQAPTT